MSIAHSNLGGSGGMLPQEKCLLLDTHDQSVIILTHFGGILIAIKVHSFCSYPSGMVITSIIFLLPETLSDTQLFSFLVD